MMQQQLQLDFSAPAPLLRVCSSCEVAKPVGDFRAYDGGRCCECIRTYKRELYQKSAKVRENAKTRNLKRIHDLKSSDEGRAVVNERKRKYRATGKGKASVKAHNVEYRPRARQIHRNRYRNEPGYNLQVRLAGYLRAMLTERQKYSRSLMFNRDELVQHIEAKFTGEMTWEALLAGEIHIDHIIPKVYFDHCIDREVRDCWCLANLQPLWAIDNLSKHDKCNPSDADPQLWATYGVRIPSHKLTGPF